MPTMVGLGFSTQVPAEQHMLDNHVRWMNEVLNPQLQALLAPMPADAELALSAALFDQLPSAQNDPNSLSADVLDLYRRPIAETEDTAGPIGSLSIFRMAATGPDHPTAEVLRAIDDYTAQLDVPAEIV